MTKRLFDLVIAGLFLLISLPFLILVGVLVRISMGAPIMFRQQRPGLHGKPFYMVKFRTMTNAVGKSGGLLPDVQRLTPVGRFLRATSLDELPEFWNVLKGEMSLVGPRPLLMEYLPLYNPDQARRMLVRPGITGWAQVHGRNSIGWDQKFALDVWYVGNQSLWLDLRILWMTIAKVFARHGISAEGEATMTKFRGNDIK